MDSPCCFECLYWFAKYLREVKEVKCEVASSSWAEIFSTTYCKVAILLTLQTKTKTIH